MKVELYIEKEEYDIFYRWINRISLGIYSTAPVRFSHRIEDIGDPLKVSLDSREYTLIKDIQTDIEEIQKLTESKYKYPNPLTVSKLSMKNENSKERIQKE